MSLSILLAVAVLGAGLYYICPLKLRGLLLLALSYAFYATCGLSAFPYMLLTTLSTWGGALAIGHIGKRAKAQLHEQKAVLSPDEKKRIKAQAKTRQRVLFYMVLVLNFGVLAVLKYSGALLSLLARPALGLVLPLGISFYTFQSMGYLIDVYNGKYAPERSLPRFALFISFFPQLIQGPIARYDQLAEQLITPHRFDMEQLERGALLMIWGLFKKKVIADRALLLVDEVFARHSQYGGAVIVVGVLFYSLQQYCDFSGGIDLVTGIAQLYGIQLAPNFKRPYFSISLGDFWRRWHISLGAWMRDYVFYPFALTKPMRALSKAVKPRLGADIARALPAALGNILVFLLVGIWHGATSNYVLWGLYNGLILAVSALLEPCFKRFGEAHAALVRSRGFTRFRVLRTFLIVNIGWYFDRSAQGADAFGMLGKTLLEPRWAQIKQGVLLQLGLSAHDYHVLLAATLILFAVSLAQERGVQVRTWLFERALAVRWALLLPFLLFVLATFYDGGTSSFLYAMF